MKMTAQEAKQKSLAANTNSSSSQLQKIISLIESATSKGEYDIWFYDTIRLDVRNKLCEMGYHVDATQFERNEQMTKIKWD